MKSVEFGAGVLFFPVTPFDRSGAVALDVLHDHLEQRLAAGPGGIFVACGTGEFPSLDPEELQSVVETAVRVTAGRVPVFAGTGGPLPVACSLAAKAEQAGADGLLVLPPYLVAGPGEGLVRYVAAIAGATALPSIVYSRANAIFDVAAATAVAGIENVVGFKDGVGDLDAMARVVSAVRRSLKDSGKTFLFFNGLPTAEVTAPAYRGIGVELYSSAAFCFVPEIASAFYRAMRRGDEETVEALQAAFYHPFVTLRAKVPGYAVSLVKAGVRLRGLDVGSVRPPLVEPTSAHLDELAQIIDDGLAAARELDR